MTLRLIEYWPCRKTQYEIQSKLVSIIDPTHTENNNRAELKYLLAAVESLTFFPSKEAKCCSRASRRLLGACHERNQSQPLLETPKLLCVYRHEHHYGQWWVTEMEHKAQNHMKSIKNNASSANFRELHLLQDVSHQPLIDDCIPAKKLLWMRA